ncbi:MAG TPA: peptidoglycan DD-metalloendopeptidase family protein [Burkholderiaceae bacterium]|nr:peptidoglycan DD-metalloendopeptidase family protein [Burkholderiaceae bacterium]
MTRAIVAALSRALLLCAGAVLLAPSVEAASRTSAGRKTERATATAAPKAPSTRQRKPAPAPVPERQKELQGEQQELRRQLARMKQQLMAAEASRTEAADALAASEAAISRANRRLRELGEERRQIERQIENLQQRSRSVTATQSRQQVQLAESLRQHHQLTLRDPLQAFLAGENPADLGRDAEYYGYLSRAASQRIGELQERRMELSQLEQESKKKSDELAAIAEDESKNRAQLVAEQGRRKQAMERLSKQISAQRQSIDKLARDERRLATLIDQLSRVLAEQARRDAEREAARRAREATPPRDGPARPAPTPPPVKPPPDKPGAEPPPNSQFAQLRGRLPMPVVGEVTGRFGAPRKVEGAGTAPAWKGIFIRAAAGTGVHAVAAGQVVFADWLRGFGNLMVIDHGEGFLSVYGNNESLLRNVGDRVAVGDVVAAVGNTGGIEQTGLYFELRFQGRPFDPLKWVATR